MNRKYTTLITASVLALAATSATGQIQSESPRQSLQIAERLMQERTGLYSAIAIAEAHTKGIAIGVRLSRNQDQYSGQDRGGLQGRTIGHTSDLNETNRQDTDRSRQTGQPQTRSTDRDREAGQTRTTDRDRESGQTRTTDRDRETGQTRTTDRDREAGQTRTTDRDRDAGQTRTTDRDREAGQTRTTDRDREAGQTRTTDRDRESAQSGPLYAIVTCVVDRARVRDVIIDMSTNTVVSVQSAERRGGEQSEFGQRSSDDRDSSRDYSSDYNASSGAAGGFARASDLMNANVRNRSGEKLGDIDDLAIDPDSNRVVYGVLRRGGFLGMGESRYAIPTSELASPQNGRIMLDLDESRFEAVSGFDNNNWPTQAESKLSMGRSTQAADAPAAKRIVKASNIIGEDVHCRDGRELGEISDLIVEPRTGRVLYAIVKADRGELAVPMSSLKKTDKAYSLPMQMDQLRSMPTLDNNRDPNWGDENWNRRTHESFGAKYETASARDGR